MSYIKRTILLFILCSFVINSLAYINVKGRLACATDDTPLSGATLRLMQLPDSALLIGTYSDKDGNFSIASSKVSTSSQKKEPVKVLLIASYMGYQTIEKVITIRHKVEEYDLKDVYMQENTHILGEALVSTTPPPMLIKGDTTEYFADSYKTQPDATVEDLLKRLPGVEVETDGSIKAQGENVQQIYVDGKEFFGNNMQVTTKNLTANMVESVQVVDMQTEEARLTGIDNGERRKVINLKLKPKMRKGWFGNAGGGWGKGRDISDRWDAKGLVGFFHGNMQNALAVNGNNTNNAAFGDTGDRVMSGSMMRGNRLSGARGNGLNSNWSIGLNLGYDKGNRMRDPNTPFALNGDVNYGKSNQEEEGRTHQVNYTNGTEEDRFNHGNNDSRNIQLGTRFEKSWGNLKEGLHRIQINPQIAYNSTITDDYSETQKYDSVHFISQTQSHNEIEQTGFNYSISGTYSYSKNTSHGRRRSSITLSFDERQNEGDQYTRTFTTFDSVEVAFDRYADLTKLPFRVAGDTLINQWSEEDSHNETYRVRLTHIEPISEHHFLEFSASVNLSDRYRTQLYHFWDKTGQEWTDSIGGRSSKSYSSDTWNRNTNYNFSASYRMTSDTYNMSVGMDLLPQRQAYTDYFDHSRDYVRHYINYSPRLEYRYNWTRRTNLHITLNGQTSQPSMNQLQARKNQTSATHVSLGNQNLRPSFNSNFSARYRTYNEKNYSTLEAGISARASFNNLVTKRWYSDNLRTDTTQTVNLSGIGNWNVQADFRGSWPFYDNIWYITNNCSFSYSENDGYTNKRDTINGTPTMLTILNTSRTYNCSEQAGISYRTEKLNIELRGNYNMQYSQAKITNSNALGSTHRFGVSANLLARLPWDFTISSDFNYTARRGYSAAMTRNQSIWNAQISRVFLEKKSMTAFFKVFDILRQRSSISRNVTADRLVDRETTVLGQYFLIGINLRGKQAGGRGARRGPGNFAR